MKHIYKNAMRIGFAIIGCSLMAACTNSIKIDREISETPNIFPDYKNITVPVNIAPLHFMITDSCQEAVAQFIYGETLKIEVKANDKQFKISEKQWQELSQTAQNGDSIRVRIVEKREGKWIGLAPFGISVSADSIDPYIAYRLIDPGYELWEEMGLYQRCLENFDEEAFALNKMTQYNCMNCHSFCQQNPEKMLFHMRKTHGGTYIVDGEKIEKLNTKTGETNSLVYPSWHPSGKFVAFSVNDTKQIFHSSNPNRAEVFDYSSDVVVYDIDAHEVITTPLLFSKTVFETFPTFSPDGRMLYFCSADSVMMPDQYQQVKYSLCAISFDPTSRQFGSTVDTLYNGKQSDKSVSLPRVSPDGQFLLFTLAQYGTFSIWHKDADLYMANLATNEVHAMETLNSEDVDSYHSWSSNGRWVIFSSRRIDGLYTRPFIAHIDKEGNATKPFLLPQNDVELYNSLFKSYNIPEFIKGPIKHRASEFSRVAINEEGSTLTFKEIKP